LAGGLLVHGGLSYRWVWLFSGLAAWALALVVRRSKLPAGEAGGRHSLVDGLRAVRDERLVLLAAAFAAGAMIEGALGTWGVLYLREQLASSLLVGTGAAAVGYGVAAVARVMLGPAAGAAGAHRGVAIGAGLAACGLVVMAVLHTPIVAGAGLVAADIGISLCWPLFLAQAASARDRPGLVVGGVSAAGSLGLVMGPALVGGLATTVGLRTALLVLAAVAVAVAVTPSRTGHAGAAVGSAA
jgi:predicted MFS family arabinose efflux permease